jgi:hypothetical protein
LFQAAGETAGLVDTAIATTTLLCAPAREARGCTVGNCNDYSAVVSGIIGSAVGSFSIVTGLKSETGYYNQPNTYSLQLNSELRVALPVRRMDVVFRKLLSQ